MKVADVYSYINDIAPFDTAEEWDNSGLLIGDSNAAVGRIGVTLDVTAETLAAARERGCDLIVSHHPVIFSPVKRLNGGAPAYLAAKYGIAVISAHTNLDKARGGVNDVLARRLGLCNVVCDEGGLARAGELTHEMPTEEFVAYVRSRLSSRGGYSNVSVVVKKAALCGGAGFDESFDFAIRVGAQALITADIKHHHWLAAAEHGLLLIDGGHYHTEYPVVESLVAHFKTVFGQANVVEIKQSSPVLF